MMMYAGGGFFWIFPLVGFSIFLIMLFLRSRHSSSSRCTHHQRKQEKRPEPREVPEEIKKAGVDLLEKLDWEIRFLEKERIETNDSREKVRIEKELQDKKADYKTVVDRLNI